MRLKQMQEFLTSFRALTNQVRRRLTESQRTAIGNTGADVQSIGFHNIPIVVEGTIRKQEYELAQARFELALLKRGRGEVTDAEVDRARMAYRDATRSFQTFWDTRRPVD